MVPVKETGNQTAAHLVLRGYQTEDGRFIFKSKFETQSTNQRGEINGLLEALKFAVATAYPNEDIIIITDSEYLHNTVCLGWYEKWRRNNWVGGAGDTVKNQDMWAEAAELLDVLGDSVFLEWTKGHLLPYTPGNTNQALKSDPEGVELYTRIMSVANRASERSRLISDFNRQRADHDKQVVPGDTAIDWVVANTVADCLASYVVRIMDNLIL